MLETVEKGAYVNLVVKWGLITLIQQTADLCEQIENVDLECPLEKGKMVLEKKVDLPKQIPPVNFPSLLVEPNIAEQRRRVNTPFLLMSTRMTTSRSPV